jgi:hypothetical protein
MCTRWWRKAAAVATLWRTITTPCQSTAINTAIAATMPIQARKRITNLFPNNATCARAAQ